MKVVYTKHAEFRLIERSIKKEWIEAAIKNPDRIIELENDHKQAIRLTDKGKISVIYTVEKENIIVITVHWGE
ncbi:MAG TPA: DUF4258 domain-containing protein [archaeon]|nr:DUF4258 domain-containing protein [archaeon]